MLCGLEYLKNLAMFLESFKIIWTFDSPMHFLGKCHPRLSTFTELGLGLLLSRRRRSLFEVLHGRHHDRDHLRIRTFRLPIK